MKKFRHQFNKKTYFNVKDQFSKKTNNINLTPENFIRYRVKISQIFNFINY